MCSLHTLFHILLLFIQTYFDHPAIQHRFVLPIAVGIAYLKQHEDLLAFSWTVNANYPISREALQAAVQRFAADVVEKEWPEVKKQGFYGNENIPCVLTHLEGIACLEAIRSCVSSFSNTRAIVAALVKDFPLVVGSPDFEGEVSVEEKQLESEDSLDEFLSSMADDVFMDAEELARRNSNPRLNGNKYKARRESKEQRRLRKAIHRPEWRAENLRKIQPPTKEEFRLLQTVNRTNINPNVAAECGSEP